MNFWIVGMDSLYLLLLHTCIWAAHNHLTHAAYPNTLTERECRTMMPEFLHVEPQTTTPPYKLEFTSDFDDGRFDDKPVKVVLEAQSKDSPLRVVLIQAHIADCDDPDYDKAQGAFQHTDDFLHTTNCGKRANSIAFNEEYNETGMVTNTNIDWYPSSGYNKDVYFRATVAADSHRVWTNILSTVARHVTSRRNSTRAPRCEIGNSAQQSMTMSENCMLLSCLLLFLNCISAI